MLNVTRRGATVITVPGNPMGKPRMNRGDKWKLRPCVLRYRAYADRLRECAGLTGKVLLRRPMRLSFTAYFQIPASWSKRKRMEHLGQPHLQKADSDNVLKGILDALFENDQFVYAGAFEKYWEDERGPRVEIEIQ